MNPIHKAWLHSMERVPKYTKKKLTDATIIAFSMMRVAVAPMQIPSSKNAENPAIGMASTQ